jgi:hypothetical protein
MQRLPWDRVVEFRGREAKGFSFKNRETGELVDLAPMLKFEYETDDGDVGLLQIRGSAFEKAETSIDFTALRRGERFRLQGMIMLQERGSGKDSYFQVTRVDPVDSATLPSSSRKTGGVAAS